MALNPGALLNKVPAAAKQTLPSNYLDFTSGDNDWAQQYLPDLIEKEAEVFGNRTIGGFLEKVGAEESMSADQVIWSEQGRLHLSYTGSNTAGVITVTADVDGNPATGGAHGVREGDTVIVSDADRTVKCYVSTVSAAGLVTVYPYTASSLTVAGIGNGPVSLFVFGSEFAKGSPGRSVANEPGFKSFSNKPIIMKDFYQISGSDASQVGWVEVSGEDGQSGYLWYLKAAGDTKSRFTDYCEMSMLESELNNGANAAVPDGTEGLFAAVESRGNISHATLELDEIDIILKEFDKQGAIEEYMMFLDRTSALAVDDFLAGQNQLGGAGASSFGVFDNDADMALNLGFNGFRRGSYDFYKTDWKYLNDKSTRGSIADVADGGASDGLGPIRGLFVPAGTSTVYDQNLGKNLKRPFLHVRYRASQMEDRKYKTWTTGSVGATTSDIDAMEMHFLTERCLIVQGANNFVMLKG